MRFLSGIIRDKRGASSVLVIFMMIVLVVLGILAFTASYANLSLAQKTTRHQQALYRLDNLAEEMHQMVEAELAKAEDDARAALRSNKYDQELYSAEQIDALARAVSRACNSRDAKAVHELFNRVYFSYATKYLIALSRVEPAIQVWISDEQPYLEATDMINLELAAPENGATYVTFHVDEGSDIGSPQLDAKLDLRVIHYEYAFANANVHGQRAADQPQERTLTAEWRFWQTPFDYENTTLDFDDVIIQD